VLGGHEGFPVFSLLMYVVNVKLKDEGIKATCSTWCIPSAHQTSYLVKSDMWNIAGLQHVHRHDTVFFWALSLHTLRFVKPGTWLCFVALAPSNFKCTFYWVLLLRDHHTHAAWPICKLSCAPLPGIMLRVLVRISASTVCSGTEE
jgi:hypothetical protein